MVSGPYRGGQRRNPVRREAHPKQHSIWRLPPDRPLTPGLRKTEDIYTKTEAIGFTPDYSGWEESE